MRLKVCELKKTGRDINAIFVEPTFSDQIDFLIDRNVPAELIFIFNFTKYSGVLHDMAMDVNVSKEQKMASIQTVDDLCLFKNYPEKAPADSFN